MKLEFRISPDFIVVMVIIGLAAPGLLVPKARAGSGCDTPPAGLASWWQAESNALDRVGGNNGTLVSGAGYAVGEVGTAFSFTNALAAVQIGNATNLQLQSFTIEAWIRRGSASSVSFPASADAEFFGFGTQGYGFGIHGPDSENGSQGTLFLTENDVDEVDTVASVTDTNFHHVAVAKSGFTVVFYVDGVAYPAGTTGDTYQFTTPAAIGARGDDLAGSFYGSIDEMSIYNRGLLASEIQGIFNAGAAGKCPVPVIVTQPVSQTVLVGSQAQLFVVAQSSNSLSYQWMLDGTNLPPATNSSLTLTNVQFTQAGSYTVAVSNFYGAVTSATAVLTVNLTPPCVPPASGLTHWWPGEGDALDVITGSNGVISGGVTFVPGMVGQAFHFNGLNGSVALGTNAGNFGTSDFTIDCWINDDYLVGSTNSGATAMALLEKRVSCDANSSFLWIGFAQGGSIPPGKIGFAMTTGGTGVVPSVLSQHVFNDAQWHHLAFVRQTTNLLFYADGALDSSNSSAAVIVISNDVPLTLGTSVCVGVDGTQPLLGSVDELDLWSRALAPAEIAAIYNAGAGGKCLALSILAQPTNTSTLLGKSATFLVEAEGSAPLLYQWSFNSTNIPGATGNPLVLANVQLSQAGSYSVTVSNQGNSVTSSNALLTVNLPPPCISAPTNLIAWWRAEGNALDELGGLNGTATGPVSYAPGEVGQGFLFGGLDAAVNLGFATNLQLQNFTIECWIRRTTNTFVTLDATGSGILLGYGIGGYAFYLLPGGQLALTYYGYSGIQSSAAVTDTNLHHVAVTKSVGTIIFYLDGVAYPYGGSYNPTFTFATEVSIGADGGTEAQSFYGLIDELAVYNRALTAAEIQSICNNGSSGKCAVPYPPVLVLVPASQSVALHGTANLVVSAAGTVPLSYQWELNGTNLAGATGPVLTLANLQISQAGSYSVTVSNSVTSLTSTNAVVTVTYPTAPIKVVATNAVAGSLVTVPVTLTANGNENSLAFSLNFTPAALTYAGIALGSGAPGGFLSDNTNLIGGGQLGIALYLPYGSTFASATDEVVRVNFLAAINTNASSSTAITFGSVPVPEQLADPLLNILPASYTAGTVTVAGVTNFEGDVYGDVRVTLADWLEEGRFVAQLAAPASPAQFQRADCAPRATLGDAALTVIDWVQAGRYALGLDPLTVTGGPTAPSGSGTPAPKSPTRLLMVSSPTVQMGLAGTVNLSISLTAQGNENAAGFTLSFPPANFSFSSATLGSGADGATLILNTNQFHSGILGAVLALPPGNSFAAGSQQLLSVNLNLVGTNSGVSSVALTSQLINCEVSDPLANPLPIGFVNGTITVNSIPALAIALSGTNVVLSWPLWASNYLLQSASGGTPPLVPWSNSPLSVTATTSNFVTLPPTNRVEFFRLDQP